MERKEEMGTNPNTTKKRPSIKLLFKLFYTSLYISAVAFGGWMFMSVVAIGVNV